MRKPRILLLLIGFGGIVWLIVRVVVPEREPECGGKRLSEWIQGYPISGLGFAMPPDPAARETDEAVRQIGTNALPHLLRWLRYEKPPWRMKLERALGRLGPSWELSDRKDARAAGAMHALIALGPKAGGGLGELVNLLHEPNACFSARRAAIVLGTLGNDGLQPLLAVLTNQQANADLRYYLAAEIEAVQTNRMAIPALRELLKDSDPALGRWASNVLQQF